MTQRILVCGGRDFSDVDLVYAELDRAHVREPVSHIIHGAATGADSIAKAWADERGVTPLPFPADWENLTHPDAVIRTGRNGRKYDARAGHRRNQKMLDEGRPTRVIAFEGGDGTADMVKRAKRVGVLTQEVFG